MMSASKEIASIKTPKDTPYQRTLDYVYGFSEAIESAVEIAHKHDMLMARMAGALAEIDLENPKVVNALGLNATFSIGTALRMYHEMDEHQKTEGAE